MGYSPAKCPAGHSTAKKENHERITVRVVEINGLPVETVERTVMCNEGKRYVTYRHTEYQVKKLRDLGDGTFLLKLPPGT